MKNRKIKCYMYRVSSERAHKMTNRKIQITVKLRNKEYQKESNIILRAECGGRERKERRKEGNKKHK